MDFKNIFNNAKIADATKENYIQKMTQIMKLYNNIIPTINEIYNNDDININNRYQFINTILAYNKHANIINDSYKKDIELYKAIQKDMNLYNNIPTKRQLENNISFDELILKIDELINDNKFNEALLLSMYVLIPPIRASYGNIVLANDEDFKEYLTTNKFSHIYNNVLYLYNLKVKTNEPLITKLPNKIIDIINELNLSTYLFTNKNNQPMTNRQFSIYANNILKSIFNKNITITDLRHIYINNLDLNKLTAQKKMDIANSMNHSINMQNKYRINY